MSSTRVASGLSQPLFVTHAPNDPNRLFIVEKGGDVEILNLATGQISATPFMTIGDQISTTSERGLLGLAFSPSFSASTGGTVYVYLTNPSGATEVRSYQASGTVANEATSNIIMTFPRPNANHNGGWIDFGPDGMLYISSGDGGGGTANSLDNPARDPNSLLGKLLRINVSSDQFPADPNKDYAIPNDNPFAGGGGAPEIWATGLRNPFRGSFDPVTHHLFLADVGEVTHEEVNVLLAGEGGQDFGWNVLEGVHGQTGSDDDAFNDLYTPPVIEYDHGSGPYQGNSVTGGIVYRGPITALQGQYIFADFISGNIWTVPSSELVALAQSGDVNPIVDSEMYRMNDDWTPDVGTIGSISSFGTDASGNIYAVDLGGEIFRLDSISNVAPTIASPTQNVTIQEDAVIGRLTGISEPTDGDGEAVRVTITSLPTAGSLTLAGIAVDVGDRIAATDLDTLIFTPNPDVTNATANQAARTLGFTFTEGLTNPSSASIVFSITPETNDFITGNGSDETLDGAGGNDSLAGLGGADTLFGATGNDNLEGGTGDDTLNGGAGIDTLSYVNASGGVTATLASSTAQSVGGGQGVDTVTLFENINGSGFADTLTGDGNANTLAGLVGDDALNGGGGNDLLFGGAGADDLSGGEGDDNLYVFENDDLLDGGNGYDQVIVLNSQAVNITIDSGVEYVAGNSGNDILSAAAMTTAIVIGGASGDDTLTGGSGDDTLAGGDGTDTVNGGLGADLLFAGTGSDNFFGGDGDDKIYILGNDGTIDGGVGFDRAIVLDTAGVSVTIGANTEYGAGNIGNDTLNASGLATAITLGGADGADTLRGGSAADTMAGGTGNDDVFGNGGGDNLIGGDGNDRLFGGAGDDLLTGGIGSDRAFVEDASGTDYVFGFENGLDKFNFSLHSSVNAFGDLVITGNGTDAFVNFNGGQLVIFGAAGQIEASDFEFV